MTEEEKIEVINKSNKKELAEIMGITRQNLYYKIKNKRDIDKIYKCLTNYSDQLKIQNNNLQKQVKEYEKIILDLNSKISKLEEQNSELKENDPVELKQQYKQLLKRYKILSDKLTMYYIESREGTNEKHKT